MPVVDDVEANIDILIEALGDEYEIRAAIDGPTALEAVEESLPGPIVPDFNMSGVDGGDVKVKLASGAETRNSPIIFLTSLLTAEEATAGGDKIGGQPMISKHLDINDIITRIEAAPAGWVNTEGGKGGLLDPEVGSAP